MKKKLTLTDLLVTGEVRIAAEDLLASYGYSGIDALDDGYIQCSVCGFYHHKKDGVDEFEAENLYTETTCNDCIDLLTRGVSLDDIPYSSESISWSVNNNISDCWHNDYNERLTEYIKSVI